MRFARWRVLLALGLWPALLPAAEREPAAPKAAATVPSGSGAEAAPPLAGEAMPPPHLSDQPFRPMAPGRSAEPRAERDCCSREHD